MLFLWTFFLSFTSLIGRFNAWLKMSHASWNLCKETKLHYFKNTCTQVYLSLFQLKLFLGCRLCERAQQSTLKLSLSQKKEEWQAQVYAKEGQGEGKYVKQNNECNKTVVSFPYTHICWASMSASTSNCGRVQKKWRHCPSTQPHRALFEVTQTPTNFI